MIPAPTSGTRATAAERRDAVLDAAMVEFATRGFDGGSTERIAHAAGISQPYVFRLFGSKLALFVALVDHCYAQTLELFREAAGELRGQDALDAMGVAYVDWITSDPTRLRAQLACYAACDDDAVREAVRRGYGSLVEFVEARADGSAELVANFFAKGMLLNVVTAMQLPLDPVPWGDRLLAGCISNDEKLERMRDGARAKHGRGRT